MSSTTKETQTMTTKTTAPATATTGTTGTIAETGWFFSPWLLLLAVLAVGACLLVAPSAMATPGAPAWAITSARAPSNFVPGDSSGQAGYLVVVTNVGGAPTDGSRVTITDRLPAGLTLVAVNVEGNPARTGLSCAGSGLLVTCSGERVVPSGSYFSVEIQVDVEAGASASLTNVVSVSGGGATGASASEPTPVSRTPVGFGFQSFDGSFTNADGSTDTQAGSHPYEATTTFNITTTAGPQGNLLPVGSPRDVQVVLPSGITGDPNAVAKCTQHELQLELCPIASQVGILTLRESALTSPNFFGLVTPVYNMVPSPGVPAALGFEVAESTNLIDLGVRTGTGYGLVTSLSDISAGIPVTGSTLTVWGVPADPSHDVQRCTHLDYWTGSCDELGIPERSPHSADAPPAPFLTLPSSCGGPLSTGISLDSWQEPGVFLGDSYLTHEGLGEPVGFDGCSRLDFSPSLTAAPDTAAASTPSGLQADLHVPQSTSPEGLGEAALKKTVVTLPAGMTINPAAANGLAVCTPEEIGLENANKASCPEASKVGSIEVVSPALESPLEGSVYTAEQGNNPFGSLLALYLVAEGDGVLVKTPAEVRLDPVTGQVTTVVDNIPQQPFSELRLRLSGGPRAPLSTPPGCGSYTTSAVLSPYSTETASVESPSAFQITGGANGTGCGALGFAPGFTAGTVNNQAGAFSPFTVTFSRSDQDQGLGGVTVTTPPGLLGLLRTVQRCGEPQAAQGTCGAGSLIGHATATAGVGPDPVGVTGQVFLTGPYRGAPFGLSVVVPAAAGPFNLGTVVVRAAIGVDPHTAQITVSSDPLPTILQGVPLQVKTVSVTVDRTGFMFNPTSCEPMSVGGTLSSTQGANANVSARFQAANCANLPFGPVFTVSTQAKTSKHDGASLDVKTVFPAGAQANIRSVAVVLPKQLPARLTTIQQACPEATFAANPAGCPAGSNIGTATATTPILATPFTGPAYLVSHGGAAFPDVVIVFQGEGVTLDLVGSVNIKHGITTSKFATVPDAPISSFELSLPEGPHSGLAAVLPAKAKGNLCGTSLSMPFTITAQNGAVLNQNIRIAVTGCAKAKQKAKKHKKHRKKKG
jgi:uncharacterized repeat protein (TIGR01451 family)